MTICIRRGAERVAKAMAEVARVRIPALCCNLRERQRGRAQQEAGALQPLRRNPCMRRLPERGTEHAREMVFGKARHFGQCAERQCLAKVGVDIVSQASSRRHRP